MTGTSSPHDHAPGTGPDGPGDIPGARPAALDRLDVLLGTWEMEARFEAGYFGPSSPAITGRSGRTTFDWLDGRFFLTQRFVNEHPAAPSGIAIIGPGASPGTFTQHYYDSRGVARTYQMTLHGRDWQIWREAPGFWQRYTAVISDDGTTITGDWHGSPDGREWKHDFGLTYIKASATA
jgi:hypothetical protein